MTTCERNKKYTNVNRTMRPPNIKENTLFCNTKNMNLSSICINEAKVLQLMQETANNFRSHMYVSQKAAPLTFVGG